MNKITKNELFKTGIKLAFAVLAFWFLSKKLDYEQLPELFFSMSYPLLFVALIFQFLSTFISGYRWKLVMDSLGFDKGFWFYQGLYFKGSFFSKISFEMYSFPIFCKDVAIRKICLSLCSNSKKSVTFKALSKIFDFGF